MRPGLDYSRGLHFYCRLLVCGGILALSAGVPSFSAQQSGDSQNGGSAVHLVIAKEGRRIAATALDQEQPLRDTQDCSHLVQQVYAVAGYDYPYASSFD